MSTIPQRLTNDNTLLDAALHYAERLRWPVLPLKPRDKSPLTAHGAHDATFDADQVRAWWQQWPGANIGVHLGGAGLVALDFDTTKPDFAGADLLADLVTNHPTTCQVSGSGGRHLLYQMPADVMLGNARGHLPVGVDVRGLGGYIAVAPSIHPSGNRYQWAAGADPHTLAPAPLPAFVLALILDAGKGVRATQPTPTPATTTIDDAALIAKIRASAHGAEFDRLWAGDTSMQHGDHSAADAALLRILAYWTGRDAGRMDALFRQSGLYRPKWERQNYREPTLDNAIEQTTNVYPGATIDPAAVAAAQAAVNPQPAQAGSGQAAQAGQPSQPGAMPYDAALNDLALTDAGNAAALGEIFGDSLRYCHTRQTWLVWDDWRWRPDDNGGAMRAALATAKARYHAAAAIADQDRRLRFAKWATGSENVNRLRATLSVASNALTFATTIDRWDTNPDLLATPAGTVDLRTGVCRPANQDDFVSMGTDIPYDPNATCPRWLQFLEEVFAGDDDLIRYIQRLSGYSLSGRTVEQVFPIAWGSGANGKSTFFDVLAALAGDFHTAASFSTFDANERDRVRDDLAALVGKRLVTVVETDEGKRLSGARVKSVTGSDPISCRHLFGKWFTYTPTFKAWLATNHRPDVIDDSTGMWRRLRLIPFTQSFASNPDRYLLDKLRAELPGILTWAVAGAVTWYQYGLGMSKVVTDATESYRVENDTIGAWLVDCCELHPAATAKSGDLYTSFKLWCEREGAYLLTPQAWGRRLSERPGIGKAKPNYVGIRLVV